MNKRLLVVALIIAVAAAITVAVFYSRGEQPSAPDSAVADLVHVEVRAMPVAKIRVDGKAVGSTPLNLKFPRSDRTIVIEATMVRHFVRPGATKDETYQDQRTIKLDSDQIVDFKISTAKLVNTEEKKVGE